MEQRPFGHSSLKVSPLGLGAGLIGGAHIQDEDAGKVLNEALDLGIRLIDTGPAFGLSEERLGKHLAHRRDEYVLCTRLAMGGDDAQGSNVGSIVQQTDASLSRLRTDHVDVLLVSGQGESPEGLGRLAEVLEELLKAGKVRVVGVSGANEELDAALKLPVLGAVEVSINVFDQRAMGLHVGPAASKGVGVIAKRPVANAPWLYEERPHNPLVLAYWDRMKAMGFDPGELTWPELAIRYAAHQPGVGSAIFGTANVRQLARQIEWVEKGPLPPDTLTALDAAFKAADRGWASLN